jgi:hypothetical protein
MCWRRTERRAGSRTLVTSKSPPTRLTGARACWRSRPRVAGELQRLTQAGLGRFALFVADWQPGDLRMLTALLDKLRNFIAAVAAQEQQLRPARRRWAGISRRDQPG